MNGTAQHVEKVRCHAFTHFLASIATTHMWAFKNLLVPHTGIILLSGQLYKFERDGLYR